MRSESWRGFREIKQRPIIRPRQRSVQSVPQYGFLEHPLVDLRLDRGAQRNFLPRIGLARPAWRLVSAFAPKRAASR
jgi:hypothetical protein